MRRFILEGKTLKGRNRVRELGNVWLLEKEMAKVGFSSEPGPWLLIFPETCRTNCRSTLCNHSRWVHGTNDSDFAMSPNGESLDTGTKGLVERITNTP